jgi:hypothetical protein
MYAVVWLSASAPLFAQETAASSSTLWPSVAVESVEQISNDDESFEDETFLCDLQLPTARQAGQKNVHCAGEGVTQNCLTYCGFFVGLGGSYNSVKLDQDNRTSAISDVFSGEALVATGVIQEQYAAFPGSNTLSGLSPMVQAGYFRNFVCHDGTDSDWLWGTQFAYKYLDLTFTQPGIDSMPGSIYTNTPDAPPDTTFTGHNFIGSTQTWVSHELALTFFVGHAINRGRVYLGGGPVTFSAETRIFQPTSFVDVNGVRSELEGQQIMLHDQNWMMGGIGQVGAMFDLGHSCFVDFSFDFTLTRPYIKDYTADFSTSNGEYTDTGTLEVSTFMAITAHSFNFTLFKRF